MNSPLKIYIAGPYSAEAEDEIQTNVHRAIDAAIAVFLKGHFPYVPHLTHFVDQRANATGLTLKWEDYIKWDMPWLSVCDALLYLGSSNGADLELKAAQNMGKQIFYSIDEVPVITRENENRKSSRD